jgi:hypothetical protein
LLATLAAQSAVVMQNAYSYRGPRLNEALENKVRSRTAELEPSTPISPAPTRAADGAGPAAHDREDGLLGFPAGVAHEINNP